MPAKEEIRYTIENREVGVPRVIYLGNINKEDSPYDLEINAPLFGELLQEEFGMTPEQVEKLDIVVVGRGGRAEDGLPTVSASGLTPFFRESGRRRIRIYPEDYYRSFKQIRKSFLRYSRKEWEEFGGWRKKVIKLSHTLSASYYVKEFFVTKRPLPYLTQAGPEHSEKFLEKLIPKVMRKNFLKLLVHEGKHAADLEREKYLFLTYPMKIGTIIGSLIAIDLGVWASLIALGAKESERSGLWGFGALGISAIFGGTTVYWMLYNLPPISERATKAAEGVVNKYRWLECVKFQVNEKQEL